jgi:hypothetical protein
MQKNEACNTTICLSYEYVKKSYNKLLAIKQCVAELFGQPSYYARKWPAALIKPRNMCTFRSPGI